MKEIISNFDNASILVIGDIMIDHYIKGNVDRISPEAPVQVVQVKNEDETLGGAGNVAANISSLGGRVTCAYVVGDDKGKDIIKDLLAKQGIKGVAIIDNKRSTTTKTRVVSRGQQLIRLDYEDQKSISSEEEKMIIEYLESNTNKFQVIVLSDYAKGVITPSLLSKVFEFAKKKDILTIIDPKPKTIKHCKGCYLITPNHIEASNHSGIKEEKGDGIIEIGKAIQEEIQSNVLITRGDKGMALFEKDKSPRLLPTIAHKVYDVTGAGDTVTAVVALGLASGGELVDSVKLANIAAGIVVGKQGTETLTCEELKKKL